MKLSVGENIKFLRKTKDITQEQLAEMVGVSCQSVSRWEQGVCYPDMELMPVLAEIFEVTVDKLMGIDNIAEKKKVDEYLERFQAAISKGQIEDCIAIAREGVAEYPNNYVLLNKLMYALFVSGDETGNIPDWKENMEKYDAEITSLGERIMKYCPDQDIRLEAMGRLAFNHCENGRKKIGRQIYESLPSGVQCRENQIWWSLEEEEKLEFLRKQIKECYDRLESFIWMLGCSGKLSPEDSLTVMNKIEALQDVICDGKRFNLNTWGDPRIPYDKAKLCAKMGDAGQVFELLKEAAERAAAFDNRPELQKYSSILLGQVVEKRTDFETADTRSLREIMKDSWLADQVFDFMRDTPEFQEIQCMLEGQRS